MVDRCEECPIRLLGLQYAVACNLSIDGAHPGPDCPYVQVARKQKELDDEKKLSAGLAAALRVMADGCPYCGGTEISHVETVAVPEIDPNDPAGEPIMGAGQEAIQCRYCADARKLLADYEKGQKDG